MVWWYYVVLYNIIWYDVVCKHVVGVEKWNPAFHVYLASATVLEKPSRQYPYYGAKHRVLLKIVVLL